MKLPVHLHEHEHKHEHTQSTLTCPKKILQVDLHQYVQYIERERFVNMYMLMYLHLYMNMNMKILGAF
jgi:hypothetical protein